MEASQSTSTSPRWDEQGVTKLVHEIILDLAPVQAEPTPEARLVEDLGYHSLSLLEMAFSLEDEFNLPVIDETTARKILTVGDVQRHVSAHLRSTGQMM
jgi:acyl carrier protein